MGRGAPGCRSRCGSGCGCAPDQDGPDAASPCGATGLPPPRRGPPPPPPPSPRGRRAGYMVEAVTGAGRAEEAFWNDQASMVLAALLHAAALAGGDMRAVHAWASGQVQTPLDILDAHPGVSPAVRDHLELYLSLS